MKLSMMYVPSYKQILLFKTNAKKKGTLLLPFLTAPTSSWLPLLNNVDLQTHFEYIKGTRQHEQMPNVET